MNLQFHLEDLSHSSPGGHSMRPRSPKPMGVIGDDGIPVDPSYTPAVIYNHRISVYGGKGTPAPTSTTAVYED